MDKGRLRRELRRLLTAMQPEQRIEKSRRACHNLTSTPEFQKASVIMMYLSLPHEVDTAEAMLQAWRLGKTVVVPKIMWRQRQMIPVRIDTLEADFSTEVPGLRNPTVGMLVPFDQIDLIVTPGLGFDRRGNRLGRGGSYYDRFFSNERLKATRCGFAFAEQVVDSVPVSEHDQPVDLLVTDEGVIYLNSRKGD
jgi:5-formyltetrahydrofolate cyclo-ligase